MQFPAQNRANTRYHSPLSQYPTLIMKKFLAFLVVVLVAAWLGLSWYTGTRIEARTGELITRLNAAWSAGAGSGVPMPQIKQVSHERGLLSSHARLALDIDGLPPGNLPEIDLTFSHGPFPLAALQQGQLTPRQYQMHGELLATGGLAKTALDMLMGGKPPLVMDLGCSYGNHCAGTAGVAAINFDMGPMAKNAKLSFGGIQMQLDLDLRSDTDYSSRVSAQFLPLSVGGQDFGGGRIEATSNAQSFNEVVTWKTGQGESKFTLDFAATRPLPMWGDPSLTPDKLPELIKSVSLKAELSKPMIIDMAARVLHLAQGMELTSAQQMIGGQLDGALAAPDAAQFVRAQGDLLVSELQYADGKLSINGEERPDLLEQMKQGYLRQMGALR
jgi:uncharacterized protein YdgA (DUF945 family)